MQTAFMDIIKNVFQASGMDVVSDTNVIDFSHKINKLQIGDSVSSLENYQKHFPDLVSVNSLNGVEFQSKNPAEGHSLFLYEINVLKSSFDFHSEYNYNYNKNTINTML